MDAGLCGHALLGDLVKAIRSNQFVIDIKVTVYCRIKVVRVHVHQGVGASAGFI
jgi:hypothetical protein